MSNLLSEKIDLNLQAKGRVVQAMRNVTQHSLLHFIYRWPGLKGVMNRSIER